MSRRPLFPRLPVLPPVFQPVVSRPMVDDFTLRANRMQTRSQPPNISPTYPLPMRSSPIWSGSQELGSEVAFAPDVNGRQGVLKMDEWGEPTVWTLHLGMTYTPVNLDVAPPVNSRFSVTGLLELGVGGAIQQCEVDWIHGTTITAALNAVKVTALYNIITSLPSDLRLRATLGRGASGRTRPPTRTVSFSQDPAPVATPIFAPIPPFAKRVWVTAYDASPTGTSSDIYTSNAKVSFAEQNVSGSGFSSLYGPELLSFPDGIPIPPGAQVVVLEWAGGLLQLFNPTAIFELAF